MRRDDQSGRVSQLKAFSNTKIDAFKTQGDLEALLAKRGINASRWSHFAESKDEPGMVRFEFSWQPVQGLRDAKRPPLGFRIEVTYKGAVGPQGGQRGTSREQAARALYWHVKNLFDAIDFGIVDLEQAFMPYLVLPSGETAYEKIGGQLASLQVGDMPVLLERGRE